MVLGKVRRIIRKIKCENKDPGTILEVTGSREMLEREEVKR